MDYNLMRTEMASRSNRILAECSSESYPSMFRKNSKRFNRRDSCSRVQPNDAARRQGRIRSLYDKVKLHSTGLGSFDSDQHFLG
jgi:hypothetical protein